MMYRANKTIPYYWETICIPISLSICQVTPSKCNSMFYNYSIGSPNQHTWYQNSIDKVISFPIKMEVVISHSTKPNKKYTAVIYQDGTKKKTIHFGDKQYEDYTTHHDMIRQQRYLVRHVREKQFWTHTKQNLYTPSYWSRYLLWEFPSIKNAKKYIES